MSELSPESHLHWEEVGSRVTENDLGLALSVDPDTNTVRTVAFGREGVIEIPGTSAYFHPNVTPVLKDIERPTPWDEALDEINALPQRARQQVLSRVERIRKGGNVAPILLIVAARQVSGVQELVKAA
jgi:hypothetical protein